MDGDGAFRRNRARRWQLGFFLLLPSLSAHAAERYESARIDGAGQLRLVTTTQAQRLPEKQTEQVGFDAPAISADGGTVGWLALFPNCCTSYPIPLALVIYRDGKVARRFKGNGMPVWTWRFEADGRQVAFEQETVHGHLGVHYELHAVDSGKLLATYDGDPAADAPKWVRDVTR
jgi:hypothetical protein